MTEIDPGTLIPGEHMIEQASKGEVSQIHRGQQYAEEGDTFEVDGQLFEVTEVTERTLGDMTDEDARAEGARDLDHYREILRRAHDSFEWDDSSEVVLHRFEAR
ncbi:MAG: ASCH domain-containing protein [Haloarculaceae archaeon]